MRGKPELIKLKDKSGNLKSDCWYIRYYAKGRSQRLSTGCKIGSQDHEATVALASFIIEREHPSVKEPEQLLIAQALHDYYEERAQFSATKANAKHHDARLKKYFSSRFVAQITRGLVDGYIRKCRDAGRSDGTTRRELAHLTAALNHAHAEGRLTHVPKFKLPAAPAPRERVLNSEEITKLLDACTTPHVRNFVILMLNTGQRPGAIENLRWEQVDFEERILHFEKDGKRQTNKRVRPLPMNDEIYTLLVELEESAETDFILEFNGQHAGCVKRAFARACKKAGLEDVSRYTLRHTYGTHLYLQGIHEKTIADLMGHTSAQTTSKHYLKSNMDILRNTVNSTALTAQKLRKTEMPEILEGVQPLEKDGAASMNRTCDPVITNDVLYH